MLPEHVQKTIAELEEKAKWHTERGILMQSQANNIRALLDTPFVMSLDSEPPASEDELRAMVTTPIEEIQPQQEPGPQEPPTTEPTSPNKPQKLRRIEHEFPE